MTCSPATAGAARQITAAIPNKETFNKARPPSTRIQDEFAPVLHRVLSAATRLSSTRKVKAGRLLDVLDLGSGPSLRNQPHASRFSEIAPQPVDDHRGAIAQPAEETDVDHAPQPPCRRA